MSEFHDPELRQQLGRLSGPYPDDNAAFAAWQRRVGQVRRRRAMAWTTVAAMALVVGVVGVAALQGQQTNSRVPQKSAEPSSSVSTSVADTHAKPLTTESTTRPTLASTAPLPPAATATSDAAVETSVNAPDSPVGLEPPVTTPETSTRKSQGGTSGTTTKTTKTATPTTPTTPAQPSAPSAPTTDAHDSHSVTQKVTSIGGTITVRLDGDHLTIIDVSPTAGFQPQQADYFGQGVGAMFTSPTHRSEITVAVYHGRLVPTVKETTETHGESVPPTGPSTSGD